MKRALHDANIVQTIQSFLPTESLLQTLKVTRIWHQSARSETWGDSCSDKKAFRALQEATGMEDRMIACGLLVASRGCPDSIQLNPLDDRNEESDDIFLMIQIKDSLSNTTDAIVSNVGQQLKTMPSFSVSLKSSLCSTCLSALPSGEINAALKEWQPLYVHDHSVRFRVDDGFDFGSRKRLEHIHFRASLWRPYTNQMTSLGLGSSIDQRPHQPACAKNLAFRAQNSTHSFHFGLFFVIRADVDAWCIGQSETDRNNQTGWLDNMEDIQYTINDLVVHGHQQRKSRHLPSMAKGLSSGLNWKGGNKPTKGKRRRLV